MSVRCFVGITLPECVTAPVTQACSAIRQKDRRWRDEKWVAAGNLHVTLKFLGDIDDRATEDLAAAICDAAAHHRPFSLPLAGISARPSAGRCRMLWLDFLDPDGACAALAASVDRVALGHGVTPESRAYAPHATLCRARRPHSIQAHHLDSASVVLSGQVPSVSVRCATVFTSLLTPRGPIYSAIGSGSLRG